MKPVIKILAAFLFLSLSAPGARAQNRLYDALDAYDAGRVLEAEAILERMVTAGNSQAMVMLAGFFETGQAGRVDLKRSGALYHRAAQAGERHAEAKWADYLARGTGGVSRDIPQALCWFTRASDAGHNWAKERLAEVKKNTPGISAADVCA